MALIDENEFAHELEELPTELDDNLSGDEIADGTIAWGRSWCRRTGD